MKLSEELKCIVETLQSIAPTTISYEFAPLFIPDFLPKLLPLVVQALKVELKPLPSHLKYVLLDNKNTFPIIISTKLNLSQEDKLIRIFRNHKETIGWTITDIKGISLSLRMHRIRLEKCTKFVRQVQRRLNPLMMEVIKREILKLLDVEMIYAISDSS